MFFFHVSRDGGKTFDYLGNGREKHSDNHALWIDPKNGKHLIAGSDAGLYESFDEGTTWRHFPNLPISQFYKLGLDNSEPFYNIAGGAQDLGTLIGPSRTMNGEGIRNQDWYVPLGADGYASHFDPNDPNIAYMEYQQGVLFRLDRRNEELLYIQPQASPGEPPERWNWDSPLLISPHNSTRLYFGSQRLWRSEDRGNAWTPISEDLTSNTNRYELEMIDRVWSVDDLYDNGAMSKYATITCISESPLTEGILYTGSDDGLIHVSENGGQSWSKCANLPRVPSRSFINDVEASSHDANTVFAVADAHKTGDYHPYLFMSTDKGKTWQSIAGDLPKNNIVWVVKQDHKDENLLFAGTEYGVYFSYNKGRNWIKLGAGVPTISFRDIALHSRDDDLVGATFGRGFYVLDDYSSLRELGEAVDAKANMVFPVRKAWWYIPSEPMQAKGMPTLGSDSYVADNPPFGALISYYISDVPKTAKEKRKELEKENRKENVDSAFPGWEELRAESKETGPQVLLLIKNESGDAIRWIKGSAKKGLHRTNWDLRYPAPDPINLTRPSFQPPWAGESAGPLAPPGIYTAEMFIEHDGKLTSQGEAQRFEVVPVDNLSEGIDIDAAALFHQQSADLIRQISGASRKLSETNERLRFMDEALKQTPKATAQHFESHRTLKKRLADLRQKLTGDPIRRSLNESTSPSISSRAWNGSGLWYNRQNPTQTHRDNLGIAATEFDTFNEDLKAYLQDLESFETDLESMGAPYTRGRKY